MIEKAFSPTFFIKLTFCIEDITKLLENFEICMTSQVFENPLQTDIKIIPYTIHYLLQYLTWSQEYGEKAMEEEDTYNLELIKILISL